MKCKVFSGRHWQTVERRAYDWLAHKPRVELHRSETLRVGLVTVKVWYDVIPIRPAPVARACDRQEHSRAA